MAKKKSEPKSPRGRKKGEQTFIPGTGPEKNARIHPVAVEYVRVRDSRMDLTKEEVKLKDRLIALMHSEGLKDYCYDDINVILSSEEKLKVKIHGHDPEAGAKKK